MVRLGRTTTQLRHCWIFPPASMCGRMAIPMSCFTIRANTWRSLSFSSSRIASSQGLYPESGPEKSPKLLMCKSSVKSTRIVTTTLSWRSPRAAA